MLNLPVSLHLNIILEEGSGGTVAVGAGPRKVVSCWGFFIGGSSRAAAAAASARAQATSAIISVAVGAWKGGQGSMSCSSSSSLPPLP